MKEEGAVVETLAKRLRYTTTTLLRIPKMSHGSLRWPARGGASCRRTKEAPPFIAKVRKDGRVERWLGKADLV